MCRERRLGLINQSIKAGAELLAPFKVETLEKEGEYWKVLNETGNIISRIGTQPIGLSAGEFVAPHGISLDSQDNIYLGEVSWSAYGNDLNPPQKVRTIQKLTKV